MVCTRVVDTRVVDTRVVDTGFVDTGLPTPCYRGKVVLREYGFSLIDSVAIAIHNFCKGLRTPREAPAKASHPVNPINTFATQVCAVACVSTRGGCA